MTKRVLLQVKMRLCHKIEGTSLQGVNLTNKKYHFTCVTMSIWMPVTWAGSAGRIQALIHQVSELPYLEVLKSVTGIPEASKPWELTIQTKLTWVPLLQKIYSCCATSQ